VLSEILSALDFVSSVEVIKKAAVTSEKKEDFFALAGLWENRNMTAESIRREAWPERLNGPVRYEYFGGVL